MEMSAVQMYIASLHNENRHVRKSALDSLLQEMRSVPAELLGDFFKEVQLYVLHSFRDQSEACRALAAQLMQEMLARLDLCDYYLTYLFPVLVERIGSPELVEESEEMRLRLVQLMRATTHQYSESDCLVPFLDDIVTVLRQSLADNYPKVRLEACETVLEVASALPRHFHLQCETLLAALLKLFTHQHFRLRMAAVAATGQVVLHGSCKALETSCTHLGQRLFDSMPLVRQAVLRVASDLATKYRDRYSFFHNILPLVLTGLSDEVAETKHLAGLLWQNVGAQFHRENEADLKDRADFPIPMEDYPTGLTRPSLGCRVLVQRHAGRIVKCLAKELEDWLPDVRLRCAQLLCVVAQHAEADMTQHLQDILPAMYRATRDSDPRIVISIRRSAELMGCFIPATAWVQLVMPLLKDCSSSDNTAGHLWVLTGFIEGSPQAQITPHIVDLFSSLCRDTICYSRLAALQAAVVGCCRASVAALRPSSAHLISAQVYRLLFTVLALGGDQEDIEPILADLAQQQELPGVQGLHAKHVGEVLDTIQGNGCRLWSTHSPQRLVFESVLLCTRECIGSHLDAILSILWCCLNPEADPEARLQTFSALCTVLEHKDVTLATPQASDFIQTLIQHILLPNIVWKAGRTAESLRSMALACLDAALNAAPLDDPKLIDELLPLVMAAGDDAPFSTRLCMVRTLVSLGRMAASEGHMSAEMFVKLYPSVIKRLDDPNETVRLVAALKLQELLQVVPKECMKEAGTGHWQAIVDCLFLHFDDQESSLKHAVGEALKRMADTDAAEFTRKLKSVKDLVGNQEGWEELSKYVEMID